MRRFLTMTALLAFAALATACSTGYGGGYGSSVPPWENTGGADSSGIYHPGMGGANG